MAESSFQRARKSTYATSLLRSCTVSYLIHFFSIIREQNKRKMEQEEGREKKRRKMKRQKPNREYVTKGIRESTDSCILRRLLYLAIRNQPREARYLEIHDTITHVC
ncbi:hypothetical protein ANTQUA_LOCUS9423 [Anthophora quadrimaculata]